MARFQYRLALLLDSKEAARKEADAEVTRCERDLETGLDRLRALERREEQLTVERERMRRELLNPAPGLTALSAAEALARSEYVQALSLEIENARNDVFGQQITVDEQERRVEQARTRAREAKREVEVMTKHRARQEQRYFRELAAKEELELDETGNVLYMTRRAQA